LKTELIDNKLKTEYNLIGWLLKSLSDKTLFVVKLYSHSDYSAM